jgi:hypothetical protein
MAGPRYGFHRGTRMVARWARSHLALWIVAATAADTALVTLVVVLITLPGQSAATIGVLVLALLVLLMLSIAFPVAGQMVERYEQTALQQQRRQEHVDRQLIGGSSTRLPRLVELSNEMLGATPTRYSAGHNAPYITRVHADEQIRGLLAVAGPPYPFVIVWGTTKAGKSRTLAEAIRATLADDTPVVLPRDGQAVADLARLGLAALLDHRPGLVVLDDIGPVDLEVLTADVLERVRDCAVIAMTMTARRRADILTTGTEVGVIARAVLAAASGEFELPSGPPVGAEKAEAERLYPEEQFEGSIAETLVGARELIARYKACACRESHPQL